MSSFFKLIGLSIVIGIYLVSCGGSNETSELGTHVGREMAINRPWVIEVDDSQEPMLFVGDLDVNYDIDFDNIPAPKEGELDMTRMVGSIPKGTAFKITRLTSETKVGVGRTFYYLTLEFLEGDYSGRKFDKVSASELFEDVRSEEFYGKPGKWRLKTAILETPETS